MEYRRLGRSDLAVSVVTLGTWAIGGFMWAGTDEELREVLQGFSDIGTDEVHLIPTSSDIDQLRGVVDVAQEFA